MSSFFSGRHDSAVEDLLSQAIDSYVLEQVAKINCAGFSDDSALPSNLESRLRRLKSLPISSSSRKPLSNSKSMESYLEKKNCAGNVSSVSALPSNLESRLRHLKSLPVSSSSRKLPSPVSALPSNLESRLRHLKSLPVSSSSRKLLSNSKSMESYLEKKNRAGNVSSVSALPSNLESRLRRLKSCPLDSSVEETRIFSGTKRTPSVSSRSELGESSDSRRSGSSSSTFSPGNVSFVSAFSTFSGKSCPLDSSLQETHILSGTKHNPRVNSRGVLGDFSDSGRILAGSARYSREGNVLTPTTQTLELVPKEKSRASSHSSTDQDQKEGMNRKSKSKLNTKFLYSWFGKLSPAQAMGCLRHTPNKSSPNS